MKTRISQLAIALFFALFLVAGNVNATDREVKASSHENIEATLEFENWMIDENVWNTSSFYHAEATESALEIENWMTNEIVWDVQIESLTIENWMVDQDIWNVNSFANIEKETEQSLDTENWMVNETIWKI